MISPPVYPDGWILRRCCRDVVDLRRVEGTERDKAALVMLAGGAALRRYDPNLSGDRDDPEALDQIFDALRARFGSPLAPAHVRSHVKLRHDELAAEAQRLVEKC